jgi:hypothetical protein
MAAGVAMAAATDLPERWRSWKYSRALTGTPASSVHYGEARVPWEAYAHCASGCSDLRIINGQGEEVPFLNEPESAGGFEQERAAHIIENSFVDGKFTQVVGDLGADRDIRYDHVTVQSSKPDFLAWAEVALSEDAKTWRVVESKAPIARFKARSIEGTQTIAINGLTSRYVRVRIADANHKFPVEGLLVASEAPARQSRVAIPASFVTQTATETQSSLWQAVLESDNLPMSQVRVATETPEFYRAVKVSGTADGEQWSYIASGVIYRYSINGKVREGLDVPFGPAPGYNRIRIEIFNGDDQPLTNVRVALAGTPRLVVFKYTEGQSYSLLYGNERATRPSYDLARYTDFQFGKTECWKAALGEEQTTANYRDPRAFTERHPQVLWTALAIAIVLIGLTALRTLRTPQIPRS